MEVMKETNKERAERIISKLCEKYPSKKVFDLDGRAEHFVCEVEPTSKHPEYDVAIEVIISSKPHMHLKTTQFYKIISGNLTVFIDNSTLKLAPGETCIIKPGTVHSAISDDECWVEIRSEPGWREDDHILVDSEKE